MIATKSVIILYVMPEQHTVKAAMTDVTTPVMAIEALLWKQYQV